MHKDKPGRNPATGDRIWLAAAVALLAVFQAVVVLRSPGIAKDGVTFVEVAQRLGDDPVAAMRQADQHPGYPAVLLAGKALADRFVNDPRAAWTIAGRTASALSGLLCVVLTWLIARRLFDARVAGPAAVIFATLPVFCQDSVDIRNDSMHLLFYLLATWCIVEGMTARRARWFAAAGAASGLAYWVRPEGLGPALVGALFIAGLAVFRREKPSAAFAWALALALSAALVGGPYAIIKGKLTGKKDLTALVEGGPVVAPSPAVAPPANTVAKDATQPESKAGRLPQAFRLLGERYAHALRYYLLAYLGLGLFAARSLRPRGPLRTFIGALALCNIVVLLVLYLVAGYISERHTLPLAALSAPWVSLGLLRLSEVVARVRPGAGAARTGAITAALVGLAVLAAAERDCRPMNETMLPLRRAGEWVHDRAVQGDSLLTNSTYAAFYAYVPRRSVHRHEAFPLDASGPDGRPYRFVIVDRRPLGGSPPDVTPMLMRYDKVPAAGEKNGEGSVLILERKPGL